MAARVAGGTKPGSLSQPSSERFGFESLDADDEPGFVLLEVPPAVRFAFVGAMIPFTITSYIEIDCTS